MSARDSLQHAGFAAGAATSDITPRRAVFLFGYPHVPRTSTGVHDALECSALYVRGGDGAALFLAHDLIFLPREMVVQVRRRICSATNVPEDAILLSATHTHSGPNTVEQLSNAADPIVPKVDAAYIDWVGDRIVETAVRAVGAAEPAEAGLRMARADGVGTNRHDPRGPSDPEVPVLVVRSRRTRVPLGCMVVYGMHPTVLHEDSTLISGDFPYFARRYLQRGVLSPGCPVIYHNGASGDQSPRHVTQGNTFAEAQRLGELLGATISEAIEGMTFVSEARVRARRAWVDLVAREFPAKADAELAREQARQRYAELMQQGISGPVLRTAECNVFGAEETAELAKAAADGQLAAVIGARSPAEIQLIEVGPWRYVGWPGEFFVEYSLMVKEVVANTFVITLANGELQGYVVTAAAAAQRLYEANNAVVAPENGRRFVEATIELVRGQR